MEDDKLVLEDSAITVDNISVEYHEYSREGIMKFGSKNTISALRNVTAHISKAREWQL